MSTLTRVIRADKPGFRAKRLDIDSGLIVESKTIGTVLSYNLATENVSRTGMLLNVGRNKRVPFLVNTILELTVDSGTQLFERPINCLGKIVRVDGQDPKRPRYGIHIVQIDARDLEAWEKGVVQMEAVNEPLPLELPDAS